MKKKIKMVFRVLKAFVLIIKQVKDIQHQNKSSDLYFRKKKNWKTKNKTKIYGTRGFLVSRDYRIQVLVMIRL